MLVSGGDSSAGDRLELHQTSSAPQLGRIIPGLSCGWVFLCKPPLGREPLGQGRAAPRDAGKMHRQLASAGKNSAEGRAYRAQAA